MLKDIALQYVIHGARAVVLMSRNQEKNQAVADEINTEARSQFASPVCYSMPGDVTKMDDCKRVVGDVVKQFGKVDILVNGAAGNFMATADKLTPNGVKKVLEIDTMGTFQMSQQVFKQSMKANRSGTIINITTSLHWNGSWGTLHANAAKAGVDAMTKTLAVEWGPYGITVNGILPGPIEGTEGFARLTLSNVNNKEKTNKSFDKPNPPQEDMFYTQYKKYMPVRRFGHVNDISNAALFLASPGASFITGTNLVVDGGQWLTSPNAVFSFPQFVDLWHRAKL